MLKFLFNRDSKFVKIVEIIGIVGLLFSAVYIYKSGQDIFTTSIFNLELLAYLFIRFCSLKRWHINECRSEGIGLHFKKALVPTSYIIAFSSWGYMMLKSLTPLIVALIALAIILHVNIILIHINKRDKKIFKAGFLSHPK